MTRHLLKLRQLEQLLRWSKQRCVHLRFVLRLPPSRIDDAVICAYKRDALSGQAHAEFVEAVAAWRPQWARLVFPREKMQTHFDDGKGHYWIPLIDPIPPTKNDSHTDTDALDNDSDSEGDEVCRSDS